MINFHQQSRTIITMIKSTQRKFYFAPNSAKKSSPLGAKAVGCFALPFKDPLDELRETELLLRFMFLIAAIAARSSLDPVPVELFVGEGVLYS